MTNLKSITSARFLKSCLIFLLCAVLLNALTYGAVAFVTWKATPDTWSWDARYLCVSGWGLEWIIAGGVAASFGDV